MVLPAVGDDGNVMFIQALSKILSLNTSNEVIMITIVMEFSKLTCKLQQADEWIKFSTGVVSPASMCGQLS